MIWSRLDSLLYQIDAASYQAAWNEARAALQQAQALVKADCQKAQRYTRLVKENGVSQQDADDAQSTCAQDKASVEAKKPHWKLRALILTGPR